MPRTVLAGIVTGARPEVGKMTPTVGASVRSRDFEHVYFVAMKFDAEGAPGSVGVWATNSLDGTAGFMSVDAVAKAFTDWADASTTDAGIISTDPAALAAADCV